MLKAKNYSNMRDNFVGYIAEKMKEGLKGFVGQSVSKPTELKVGDVAVVNMFTQFYADRDRNRCDPEQGVISLNMTFYGVGHLMLVLELSDEKGQAYVLSLDSGNTGWIDKGALARYQ